MKRPSSQLAQHSIWYLSP
jgi:phenylacetate 2-hydroxylase